MVVMEYSTTNTDTKFDTVTATTTSYYSVVVIPTTCDYSDSDYKGTISPTNRVEYICKETSSPEKKEIIELKKEFSVVKKISLPINCRVLNKMIKIRTERLRMYRKIC